MFVASIGGQGPREELAVARVSEQRGCVEFGDSEHGLLVGVGGEHGPPVLVVIDGQVAFTVARIK